MEQGAEQEASERLSFLSWGDQGEPQRGLSRGGLLSAVSKHAMPAIAVRAKAAGEGWGVGLRRVDWKVLGTDLEEGQEGRMLKGVC